MNSLALKKFSSNVGLNRAGELNINAGIYSRTAIIMAFELNGGIEKFAEWAEDNPSEFYTKLFGKLVGREVEAPKTDNVEDLLDVLDLESKVVQDLETEPVHTPPPQPPSPVQDGVGGGLDALVELSDRGMLLMEAARAYADAEPLD